MYRELIALGLVESGTPTSAFADLPEDVQAASEHLPAVQSDGLIVQPDGTVIAPLALDNSTWALLQSIAHVESWGPVTMHRIESARLQSAVNGRDPQQVIDALAAASRTAIPQSIEYLIRDAARSAGVNVYPATVIEGAGQDIDRLKGLGLTQVSEQVFTSPQSPEEVVQLLAEAGVATSQGPAAVLGVPLERANQGPGPDEAAVARLVEHLLDGHAVPAEDPPALAAADPATVADVCRQAISEDRRVWVQYADGDGVRTELVEPIDLRVGRLSGWSLHAARMITVPLSRIAAVGSSDD